MTKHTQWDTPIGEARLNRALRHAADKVRDAQRALTIERETSTTATHVKLIRGATAGGDERALRGIPVVGAKGVGGAINGSRPGARLI